MCSSVFHLVFVCFNVHVSCAPEFSQPQLPLTLNACSASAAAVVHDSMGPSNLNKATNAWSLASLRAEERAKDTFISLGMLTP